MLVKNPSHRKALQNNQITTLKIICKFQFITVPLLSQYLAKDRSTCYEQLLTLVSQEYVHKRYYQSYRIRRLPARYYLADRGLACLKNQTELSDRLLAVQRRNQMARPQLVEDYLARFALCNQLRRRYPAVFEIFTKTELVVAEDFIRPRPDLYVRPSPAQAQSSVEYFVEQLPVGVPSWRLRKRLRTHDDLAAEADYQYPQLLLVCANESTVTRLQKIVATEQFDLVILTTTLDQFYSDELVIWRQLRWDYDEEAEPQLTALSTGRQASGAQ